MSLRKVVTAVLLAAALLVSVNASPAAADTFYTKEGVGGSTPPDSASCVAQVYYGGGLAGVACFASYGDVLWIRDAAADGHHVEARGVLESVSRGFICTDNAGKDGGWRKCSGWSDLIPENDVIGFRAEVWEGDTRLAGGPFIYTSTS